MRYLSLSFDSFSTSASLHERSTVAIMRVELQTGKKQQMDSHYVNAPEPYVVEENFEGYFPDHNDLTLAQILQDQETVYESLQRDGQFDTGNSSSTTTMGDRDGRLQSRENSSQTVIVDSQLAMDEEYARELQELENQLSYASLNRTSATGTDFARAQSATSNSEGTSANNTATQVDRQDNVDPDNMTYEELQSLGEAIGKASRGLSDELISYLPTSTYKNGLFSRREKIEECVICCMPYENRDKLITLPCQHQYHKDCVSHWLKINKVIL
ncbi:E3 ubiquitin ligase BIG BROTHER-related-like isoform X1 [Dendrobium catenatum]|nr:E3 ubiquitin ligase BIG BROTHER-related-like isoform X1 [Dendrobium catenatum]XP_020678435.1 E3 ubiquitin ligase BIG BROTHER-related-like isoform X1 [Dendrobium catenatum]XP_028551242.1 E3 ubiquitin ligase BIG BROTHER-related-like isoform X1 [Dendrobium catenatum]XP_028551243.1 E3 ubiquitin ligase BIG BROTHER-related-like isoform X1 [Dendrobium catenatum]